MYQVYVLQSLEDNRTYTGYAKDVQARLAEHNAGRVKATCHRRPFQILYIEDCKDEREAKQRERYWKSGAGRRRLKVYFDKGFPPRS